MAPARKRRKLPTLIDRGLGLLEVILPHGADHEPITTLPEGQRDPGGFWYPAGYIQPGDIFTPAQRRLQAKQRQVQRGRHERRDAPSRPHAPPAAPPGAPTLGTAAVESDRALPLPAPSLEAPGAEVAARPVRMGFHAPPQAHSAGPSLHDQERSRVVASLPVVDSHKGSD